MSKKGTPEELWNVRAKKEELKVSEPPFSINISFSRFARYFVPGFYAASLIIIYAIRISHSNDIIVARELLTYLHSNWSGIVGMVAAFGGFLGFCLVGIDLIIAAIVGSRLVRLIFKYLLSSKLFSLRHFSYMLYHDMHKTFQDLPIATVEDRQKNFPHRIRKAEEDGTKEEKWILNEILRNQFWYGLPSNTRVQIKQTYDFSSMFSYLSFVTGIFFFFQLGFFVKHLFSKICLVDSLFFTIVLFMVVNLVSNLKNIKRSVSWKGADLKSVRRYVFLLVVIPLAIVVDEYVYASLPWFSVADVFLLCIFFILSVSFFWSSSVEYSRFILNYEREFILRISSLKHFAEKTSPDILELMRRYH